MVPTLAEERPKVSTTMTGLADCSSPRARFEQARPPTSQPSAGSRTNVRRPARSPPTFPAPSGDAARSGVGGVCSPSTAANNDTALRHASIHPGPASSRKPASSGPTTVAVWSMPTSTACIPSGRVSPRRVTTAPTASLATNPNCERVPVTAASTRMTTVSVVPRGSIVRVTAAAATTVARPSDARKHTMAAPRRSTTFPASTNAAIRGVHSRAKARPVKEAELVIVRTRSGIAYVDMENAKASLARGA